MFDRCYCINSTIYLLKFGKLHGTKFCHRLAASERVHIFSIPSSWPERIGFQHLPRDLANVNSEPEFYGDLVYKFRKIIGKNDFPYHFKKIIVRYKKIGYNINVMRQTACSVVNPIKVNSFAYLFNCTTVGRTSD